MSCFKFGFKKKQSYAFNNEEYTPAANSDRESYRTSVRIQSWRDTDVYSQTNGNGHHVPVSESPLPEKNVDGDIYDTADPPSHTIVAEDDVKTLAVIITPDTPPLEHNHVNEHETEEDAKSDVSDHATHSVKFDDENHISHEINDAGSVHSEHDAASIHSDHDAASIHSERDSVEREPAVTVVVISDDASLKKEVPPHEMDDPPPFDHRLNDYQKLCLEMQAEGGFTEHTTVKLGSQDPTSMHVAADDDDVCSSISSHPSIHFEDVVLEGDQNAHNEQQEHHEDYSAEYDFPESNHLPDELCY